MKKSIIALALLSSAALAAEIPTTTDITNYTETTGHGTASWNTDEVDSPLDSWAFTFTVSVSSSASSVTDTKTILTMTSSGSSGNTPTGIGVRYDYGNTRLVIGRSSETLSSDSDWIDVTSGVTYTLAYDASTYTVYLGSSDGKYITYDLTSLISSGETVITTLTSDTLQQWTNTGTVFTTITSVADLLSVEGNSAAFASYVTTGSVPEPATATLGLLALGALALRRRRA